MHNKETGVTEPKRHVVMTCYDRRIDGIVDGLIAEIRLGGGLLTKKDVLRPPGGVHLFAGKSSCREAFYNALSGYRNIVGTTVFHFWPHTNCQFCGTHLQEKIGDGTKSDLRFHLTSAEKILKGAIQHFENSAEGGIPEFDARIILTIDQRIITIDEAHALLPLVPPHHEHGRHCCAPTPIRQAAS